MDAAVNSHPPAPNSPRGLSRASARRGVGESLLLASGASLLFISWGAWVNWSHGLGAVVQVALTQGAVSFASTFLSAEMLRRLYLALAGAPAREFLTIGLGLAIINGTVFAAHWTAGTPEILPTMAPGIAASVFFCSAFTYRQRRVRRRLSATKRETP